VSGNRIGWKEDTPAFDVRFLGVWVVSNELGAALSPSVAAARLDIVGAFRSVRTEFGS
jgi:hypothetical protein